MTCLIFLLRLHMRMMLRIAPHCWWELKNDYGWIEHEKWAYFIPGLWRLSTGCFLLLHFLLFSSFPLSVYCTLTSLLSLFSMPPTVGCVQYSTPQNMYIVEDQPHRPTHPPLSRSAVLPCPPLLGIWYSCVSVHTWRMSSSACTWAQIDLPECDRHVRTYAHTLRE